MSDLLIEGGSVLRPDLTVERADVLVDRDAGEVVAVGDPSGQARRAMENVVAAVEAAGGGVGDVVRTRMYVVDIDDWNAVGRAHAEVFGDVRPATTMVEVSRLIDPDLLVEVEAEAVVGGGDGEDPEG